MTLAQSFTLLSAILGIGGTLVLLFANYTFQSLEDAPFNSSTREETNKRIKVKNKRRYKILNFGLALLCGGFVLQAVIVFLTHSQRVVGKTAAYVAGAGDCGKIFSLSGNTFYTFTLGSASGFSAECSIIVYNADSGRGKGMNVPGIATFVLWPLQTVTFSNTSSGWIAAPSRQLWIAASPTIYVNFLNGSNDPLVTDCFVPRAGACKTFNYAINTLGQSQFFNIGVLNIQADCESQYDETINVAGFYANTHVVNIVGNSANPAACVINRTVSGPILNVQDYGVLVIDGFTLSSNVETIFVLARQAAIVDTSNMIFGQNGPIGSNGTHVLSTYYSSVNMTGTTILKSTQNATFAAASLNATITLSTQVIVNAPDAVGFTSWFSAGTSGSIDGNGISFLITGAVSGQQFHCFTNATIQIAGGYPSGLTSGTAASGCQHVP
jgi:hypothetical protein